MSKVDTVKISGDIDYAKVPERLKHYREDNPKSDVTSRPIWNVDGEFLFAGTF